MRIRFLTASLLLVLGACNPVTPLTNAEKAKFVYELIEVYPTCDSYRKRLDAPAVESPAIAAIYQEAIKAGCIKRDV